MHVGKERSWLTLNFISFIGYPNMSDKCNQYTSIIYIFFISMILLLCTLTCHGLKFLFSFLLQSVLMIAMVKFMEITNPATHVEDSSNAAVSA